MFCVLVFGVFCFGFGFVGLGGPGGGFGDRWDGFSDNQGSGKPEMLRRLTDHPQEQPNQKDITGMDRGGPPQQACTRISFSSTF